MTQISSWNSRKSVKKGDIGESLVDAFLLAKGCIPYAPQADKAHPFDRLCATGDKKTIFIAEVKTKARRTKYPDTGIDSTAIAGYSDIQEKHRLRVFIFFVDEGEGRIYGNWLNDLRQQIQVIHNGKELSYPMTSFGIVYFPMEVMRDICELKAEVITELRALSSRCCAYYGDGSNDKQRDRNSS